MSININLVGGTRTERTEITDSKDGILEGLKYLAMGFGSLLKIVPTEILLNVYSTVLYTNFLALADNNRLSEENTLAHVASVGGEIAFLDSFGNTLNQFSIIPLYSAPRDALKNPTTYNIWWSQYRTVKELIASSAPSGFTMIRYTVKESITVFTFTTNAPARSAPKIQTFNYN